MSWIFIRKWRDMFIAQRWKEIMVFTAQEVEEIMEETLFF